MPRSCAETISTRHHAAPPPACRGARRSRAWTPSTRSRGRRGRPSQGTRARRASARANLIPASLPLHLEVRDVQMRTARAPPPSGSSAAAASARPPLRPACRRLDGATAQQVDPTCEQTEDDEDQRDADADDGAGAEGLAAIALSPADGVGVDGDGDGGGGGGGGGRGGGGGSGGGDGDGDAAGGGGSRRREVGDGVVLPGYDDDLRGVFPLRPR